MQMLSSGFNNQTCCLLYSKISNFFYECDVHHCSLLYTSRSLAMGKPSNLHAENFFFDHKKATFSLPFFDETHWQKIKHLCSWNNWNKNKDYIDTNVAILKLKKWTNIGTNIAIMKLLTTFRDKQTKILHSVLGVKWSFHLLLNTVT